MANHSLPTTSWQQLNCDIVYTLPVHDVTRAISAIIEVKRRHCIGTMIAHCGGRTRARAHSYCTNEMPSFHSQTGTFCTCAIVYKGSMGLNLQALRGHDEITKILNSERYAPTLVLQ